MKEKRKEIKQNESKEMLVHDRYLLFTIHGVFFSISISLSLSLSLSLSPREFRATGTLLFI